MPSTSGSDTRLRQMQAAPPRSFLNCRTLSIHLPPPPSPEQYRSRTTYLPLLSPSMSTSSDRPLSSHLSYRSEQHQQSTSPAFVHSASRKLDSTGHHRRSSTVQKTQGSVVSPRADEEFVKHHGNGDGGLHPSTGTITQEEEDNDDLSANTPNSPSALQFAAGSPGVARRAKAHVPSACVNCKRKHLACETRRPCSRCIQAGKEASCVDVQHKKRGRPRLRDEENGRGAHFGSEYPHTHLYPAQPDVLSLSTSSQRGHQPNGSYRELRSQPAALYADPSNGRPVISRTSDPTCTRSLDAFPSVHIVPDSTPTALLTLDFVIARSNYAFSDALCLRTNAEGRSLRDLIIPSERDKIQRLQNSLRAELQDTAQLPPSFRNPLSQSSFSNADRDLLGATTGFQPRSEYWTFRLPNEQSRGFPVTVCLAKTTVYFIVLTLVSSNNSLPSLPAQSTSQGGWPQSLPSPASAHSNHSPSWERQVDRNSFSGYNQMKLSYHPAPTSTAAQHMMQPLHGNHVTQYQQRSPPQSHDSGPSLSNSNGTTRSSAHGPDMPRDSLRHLQLPPIRTTGLTETVRSITSKTSSSNGRHSSAKDSPQSAKKKKRRRVDIGEMLH